MALSGLEPRLRPLTNPFVHVVEEQSEGAASRHRLPVRRRASFPGYVPHALADSKDQPRDSPATGFEVARCRTNTAAPGTWLHTAATQMAPVMPVSASPSLDVMLQRGRSRHANDGIVSGRWTATTTTVMVRNLPSHIVQKAFMDALNVLGFDGQYDFCYVPSSFENGTSKGYGFVNFTSSNLTSRIRDLWHGERPFNGVSDESPCLNVTPATIQGFRDNVAKLAGPKMKRIRNPNLRPFVLDRSQPSTSLEQ